jgi:hypothetical protein
MFENTASDENEIMTTESKLICGWCGKTNDKVLELCQHCGKPEWTAAPIEKLPFGYKTFTTIGMLSGLILIGVTGVITVILVVGSRFPGDRFVGIIAGFIIWYGLSRGFRRASIFGPPLRWLFPYQSWTGTDD